MNKSLNIPEQKYYDKIIKYNEYIKTIDKILLDIDKQQPDTKQMKHNPFSLDIVDIKVNDKKQLEIKYKNGSTILFNYNENYRSFSFEPNVQNHINLIKNHLNNEKNFINICIEDERSLLNQINNDTLTYNDCFSKLNYNLNDILKFKQLNKKNNYEYYLSICPIGGFILKNGNIYIANQYQLKFENNKFHIFYNNTYKFEKLLERHNLKDKILDFNKNNNKITTDNFLIIISNMGKLFTDCNVEINGKKIECRLNNIDEPINTPPIILNNIEYIFSNFEVEIDGKRIISSESYNYTMNSII